jgi:Flp pilus assembly pilin Flp
MEWMYAWQGRAHAELAERIRRAGRDEAGQGTVEYVGLILLVAVILAGVVKASGGLKDDTIAEAVIKKLKGAIDQVGKG